MSAVSFARLETFHLNQSGLFQRRNRINSTATMTIGIVHIPNVSEARKKHQAYTTNLFMPEIA